MNIIKKYGQQIDLDELMPDLLLLVFEKIRLKNVSFNTPINFLDVKQREFVSMNQCITYENFKKYIRSILWFNIDNDTYAVKIDIPMKKVI